MNEELGCEERTRHGCRMEREVNGRQKKIAER